MIRYKVLKASTKGHFTNIISAARELPAGLFRPRPCAAMGSEVRGAICLARAHFPPNEYNKNRRGHISVKIGINLNPGDWRRADEATLTLCVQTGSAERFSRSPSFPTRTPHPTCHCPTMGTRGEREREGCTEPALLGFSWTEPESPLSPSSTCFSAWLAGGGGGRGAQASTASLTLTSRSRLGRTQSTIQPPPFPKASPDPELEAYLLFKVN